jgi:hypothetical protein
MSKYSMPLSWSDNLLAHNLYGMVTSYRFRSAPDRCTFELPDYRFAASGPDELADVLVTNGLQDGTVQVGHLKNGLFDRHESMYGMAARFRARDRFRELNISPDRLSALFVKSGRGLRRDVDDWWNTQLSPASQAWRLRRYAFAPGMRLARRRVDDFLEFGSDTDMIAFKLRWM